MDFVKAKELESRLAGKTIGKWTIEHLKSHGKSAAVFRATGADGQVAIKIFDNELIARYGDDTQFARIDREKELIGKAHPNLVSILGGGFDNITKNHYLVMEYLDGPSLKECLQQIPADCTPGLIAQLASAASYLETLGYVHRDIKPDNIVILDNFHRAVLLDLGVLRPFSGSDLTDSDGIQAFIGTLQYSSPEFLLRKEEQSPEGYRALTFYQLGAVLHDLIMRKPIFSDVCEPYARLVNAVQHDTPEIQNSATPHYLVELARCCLLKPWKTRLRLVSWASFSTPVEAASKVASIKQRVTNRTIMAKALNSSSGSASSNLTHSVLRNETIQFIKASARSIRSENTVLPPIRFLPNTPDCDSIGIQFNRSQESALTNDLTIVLRIDILDCAARMISISAGACIGSFNTSKNNECAITIFEGSFDVAAISSVLENCIYDLIDQAQATPTVTSAVWISPRSDF
ncbi:serine/threonine protein kinase [Rhodopseudomonas palustris]|uniref:serine/threonine protein kinase n=1 Tax=Rhodopseudomonas palustris TaxID=1076 RepID=UPI0021F36849|nr:protein kinase [Rhodopseudomonas palustris]UYO53753.1 protein kinase [Rhodopseudomonas palustris]